MVNAYQNWPSAVLNRFGLLRRNGRYRYRIRLTRGSFVTAIARGNGFDIRAMNELFIGRVYDRWYDGPIPAGTIVDLGANCGYFTLLASHLLQPEKIVAVEPDSENRAVLTENLRLNEIDAIIVPEAVAPFSGASTLRRSRDPRLHTLLDLDSTALSSRGKSESSAAVNAITISQLFDRHVGKCSRVSLMKVDIEGMEWPVLESIEDELWASIDCVVVESDSPIPADLTNQLAILGFAVDVDKPFWVIRRR